MLCSQNCRETRSYYRSAVIVMECCTYLVHFGVANFHGMLMDKYFWQQLLVLSALDNRRVSL